MNDREFEIFLLLVRIEVEHCIADGKAFDIMEIAKHAAAAKLLWNVSLEYYSKQSE